jgi:hypothetical protein
MMCLRSRLFAHYAYEIAFAVARDSKPDILVPDASDATGVFFEFGSREDKIGLRGSRILNRIIEDRIARSLGTLGLAQHQPRLPALEEGQAGRGVEQVSQAEDFSIEMLGAVNVANCDGNLRYM